MVCQQVVRVLRQGIGEDKDCRELGIQMPISEQVYRVIFDDLDPASAVTTLLGRAPREETD